MFLLTDGSVRDRRSVIDYCGEHSDSTRVFTFGLGTGCDARLVDEAARKGRGTSTIVGDDATNLNGLVIKALSNAMQPSLKDTVYGFNFVASCSKELYRN